MSKSPKEIAKELQAEGVQCNCDLDNWEPELRGPRATGHSWVCRIHRRALNRYHAQAKRG